MPTILQVWVEEGEIGVYLRDHACYVIDDGTDTVFFDN